MENLGKQVGDYYNKIAAHLNEIWHSSVSPDIRLPFLARGSRKARSRLILKALISFSI